MNWPPVQPDQFPGMFELRVYVDICIKWIDRSGGRANFFPATEELCGNNVTGILTELRDGDRRHHVPPPLYC